MWQSKEENTERWRQGGDKIRDKQEAHTQRNTGGVRDSVPIIKGTKIVFNATIFVCLLIVFHRTLFLELLLPKDMYRLKKKEKESWTDLRCRVQSSSVHQSATGLKIYWLVPKHTNTWLLYKNVVRISFKMRPQQELNQMCVFWITVFSIKFTVSVSSHSVFWVQRRKCGGLLQDRLKNYELNPLSFR